MIRDNYINKYNNFNRKIKYLNKKFQIKICY